MLFLITIFWINDQLCWIDCINLHTMFTSVTDKRLDYPSEYSNKDYLTRSHSHQDRPYWILSALKLFQLHWKSVVNSKSQVQKEFFLLAEPEVSEITSPPCVHGWCSPRTGDSEISKLHKQGRPKDCRRTRFWKGRQYEKNNKFKLRYTLNFFLQFWVQRIKLSLKV